MNDAVISEFEQKSAQWLFARAGHCTASRFRDVLAKVGKGEAAARRNYRVQIAVERLTGQPSAGFENLAMQHGNTHEPDARMGYEARTGEIVEETGFILHPTLEWCGGSPDGLIGEDGGLEIKCPYQSAVHVETLLAGAMPDEHRPQVQGLMWITGRKWWDFVSYDPRMPAGLDLFIQRIPRDDEYIAMLAGEVEKFLGEVDAALQGMQAKLDEYRCFVEVV